MDKIVYDGENGTNVLNFVRQIYPSAYVSLSQMKRNKRGKILIIDFNLSDKEMKSPSLRKQGWIYLNKGSEVTIKNGDIEILDSEEMIKDVKFI